MLGDRQRERARARARARAREREQESVCICTHTHARTHARIGDKSNARRHTQTFEARKSGAPSDDLSAGIAAHMAALSHEFVGSLFVTVAVHGKEGDSLRHSLSVCACVRARAHVCVCVCVCVCVRVRLRLQRTKHFL